MAKAVVDVVTVCPHPLLKVAGDPKVQHPLHFVRDDVDIG